MRHSIVFLSAFSGLLTFANAASDQEYGFGYFGYSHHSTAVEPHAIGFNKEYEGTSSLYPTAACAIFGDGFYAKLDYEGTFAALASYLNFGNVSGSNSKSDTGASGAKEYAGHMSGLLVPRTELGLGYFTGAGYMGLGINLDLASMGLSASKDFSAKMTSPGTSFDFGIQAQYIYTVWPGFHINPSFTYNLMFTDRQQSAIDGTGMNFEAAVTFKVLPFMSLHGTFGYDIRDFKQQDGNGDTEASLSDMALKLAIALHDIPSPFSNAVYGHN
jgi:hypothetical protein